MRERPALALAWFICTVFLVVAVSSIGYAQDGAPSLSAITGALNDSEAEIRGPIFSAVVGILTAILLIGVGAGVVRLISRNT